MSNSKTSKNANVFHKTKLLLFFWYRTLLSKWLLWKFQTTSCPYLELKPPSMENIHVKRQYFIITIHKSLNFHIEQYYEMHWTFNLFLQLLKDKNGRVGQRQNRGDGYFWRIPVATHSSETPQDRGQRKAGRGNPALPLEPAAELHRPLGGICREDRFQVCWQLWQFFSVFFLSKKRKKNRCAINVNLSCMD